MISSRFILGIISYSYIDLQKKFVNVYHLVSYLVFLHTVKASSYKSVSYVILGLGYKREWELDVVCGICALGVLCFMLHAKWWSIPTKHLSKHVHAWVNTELTCSQTLGYNVVYHKQLACGIKTSLISCSLFLSMYIAKTMINQHLTMKCQASSWIYEKWARMHYESLLYKTVMCSSHITLYHPLYLPPKPFHYVYIIIPSFNHPIIYQK